MDQKGLGFFDVFNLVGVTEIISNLHKSLKIEYKLFRKPCMPQGISRAPEEYQRHQNEALTGLVADEIIVDNIVCYGSNESMEEASGLC